VYLNRASRNKDSNRKVNNHKADLTSKVDSTTDPHNPEAVHKTGLHARMVDNRTGHHNNKDSNRDRPSKSRVSNKGLNNKDPSRSRHVRHPLLRKVQNKERNLAASY
jgi:hypothetical protein